MAYIHGPGVFLIIIFLPRVFGEVARIIEYLAAPQKPDYISKLLDLLWSFLLSLAFPLFTLLVNSTLKPSKILEYWPSA